MTVGTPADDSEDLVFAFQLADDVAIGEADSLHRGDRAAADHATHGVDRHGFVVPHFKDAAPAGRVAQRTAEAGVGIHGREPEDILAGDPMPLFIFDHYQPPLEKWKFLLLMQLLDVVFEIARRVSHDRLVDLGNIGDDGPDPGLFHTLVCAALIPPPPPTEITRHIRLS